MRDSFKAECVRQENLYTCKIWRNIMLRVVLLHFLFLYICLAMLFPLHPHALRLIGHASRHLAGSLVLTEMPKLFLLPISESISTVLQHPLAIQSQYDDLARFHASPFYS